VNKILNKTPLTRFTDNTITDKKVLLAQFEEIRKKGYAISKGEHLEQVQTISAPLFDFRHKVIAAVSIAWVPFINKCDLESEYLNLVKETAHKISLELG
jgi:IclR family KDG regulon transcriptional repressor